MAHIQEPTDRPDERRACERTMLSVPCCIRPSGRVRSAVGQTRNVSTSGALVQLPPGGPELAHGDEVMVALVPPQTGIVDAGDLKPARVVRTSAASRGALCIAVTWGQEAVPSLLADPKPLPRDTAHADTPAQAA